MRSPPARFAINFFVYLVFGGGILAFTSQRAGTAPVAFGEVVMGALAVALWSGTLTTLIETKVIAIEAPMKRSLLAGLFGALSLGGFATILSSVAWRAPELGFIAIGVVAGGLMQAARAFSAGARAGRDEDEGADMDPKQLIANGALVLDVRRRDEWDAGHLPTAKHVPVDELEAKLADVEAWAGSKDKPIVVHCKSGGRSGRARTVLLAAGFTHVVNGGGYDALK